MKYVRIFFYFRTLLSVFSGLLDPLPFFADIMNGSPLRGRSQMTSAKFLGFWTPSQPCHHFGPIPSTKITQPPLLRQNLINPPPSPSLLMSFVNGPMTSKMRLHVASISDVRCQGAGSCQKLMMS